MFTISYLYYRHVWIWQCIRAILIVIINGSTYIRHPYFGFSHTGVVTYFDHVQHRKPVPIVVERDRQGLQDIVGSVIRGNDGITINHHLKITNLMVYREDMVVWNILRPLMYHMFLIVSAKFSQKKRCLTIDITNEYITIRRFREPKEAITYRF